MGKNKADVRRNKVIKGPKKMPGMAWSNVIGLHPCYEGGIARTGDFLMSGFVVEGLQ